MAQTNLTLEIPLAKFKGSGVAKIDATLSIDRCECGHCKTFILALAGKHRESRVEVEQSMVLPIAVLDFLAHEVMEIMALEKMVQ